VINFLDSLALMCRLADVPAFAVWIIGGSDGEAAFVESLIHSRTELSDLHANGALTIWGRLATEALPELYSRSRMVIMPSAREQFGIVGVEAMMCGCPVIATAVGGLPDIVLEGYTGTIVEPDSPAALANAMLGYLRNPDRACREGINARRWALQAFSRDKSYGALAGVYRGAPIPTAFASRSLLRQLDMEELRLRAKTILNTEITAHDVSSSDHSSAIIETPSERFFCKWYRPERSDHISVLPVPASLRRERSLTDYIAVLKFHRENGLTPRIIRMPEPDDPMAFFECCQRASLSKKDTLFQIRRLAEGFRSFRTLDPENPDASRYMDALRSVVAHPTLTQIAEHDLAAAELNARSLGSIPRFYQVHPHVELIRIQLLMREEAWSLPAEIQQRFDGAIAFTLNSGPIPVRLPAICHGSLKPEHLLVNASGAIVACDTDHSRYVVGPIDEVHHVWNELTASTSFGTEHAMDRMASLTDSAESFALATSWLLVYLLFDGLLAISLGRNIRGAPAVRFCRDFPYTYRQFVIQSRRTSEGHLSSLDDL